MINSCTPLGNGDEERLHDVQNTELTTSSTSNCFTAVPEIAVWRLAKIGTTLLGSGIIEGKKRQGLHGPQPSKRRLAQALIYFMSPPPGSCPPIHLSESPSKVRIITSNNSRTIGSNALIKNRHWLIPGRGIKGENNIKRITIIKLEPFKKMIIKWQFT